MDEKNETNQPRRYVWPWFVLGAAVLGVVLAIFWMSVLVHRVREQRESDRWPATTRPVQTVTSPSVSTQAVPVVPLPNTNSARP